MNKSQIKKLKDYYNRIFLVLKGFYIKKILPILKDPFFCSYWDIYGDTRRSRDNELSVRSGVYSKAFKYTYKGSASMVVEDIYSGIMPLMHIHPKNDNFKVSLIKENKTLERIIANGLARRSVGNSWLNEAVSDFIQDTTHWLTSYGEIWYEVVYKKDDAGNIESFDLVSASEADTFRFFNNYYQIIPWWVAKKNRIKAQIVKIPKNKIFKITFPKELGGKKKLIRAWKRLWQLSNVIIPEFVMQAMEENKDIGYNTSVYHNTKELESAMIASHLGWNMRGGLSKLTLEYHTLYSFLKAEKAKAILREHILKSLNEILNCELLNFKTKIKMEGLPDVKFVNEKMKELSKGDVAFMDIFNSLKY